MLDNDTVEIVKRNEYPKRSWLYTWGADNKNLYERVILNRSECSVAIDRLDSNYYVEDSKPFLAQRDHFYIEKDNMAKIAAGDVRFPELSFIRYNFWLPKLSGPMTKFYSNFAAMSYKSAFNTESIE